MNRLILRLAIPNILANLSVPLLGLTDTVLMGHMPDAAYLGAIALGGVLFNMVYWSFGFLRASTVGLTAQAFGEGHGQGLEQVQTARSSDPSSASAGAPAMVPTPLGANTAIVLRQALGIALSVSVVMLLLQGPIAYLGFQVLNGEPDVEALARQYWHARIWGAPANLALMALTGWFLGMQNARIPLYLTLLSNAVNIGLSVLLVRHFELGVLGVAWGTVVAQYATLGLAVLLLLTRYPGARPWSASASRREGYSLGRYFGVSRDLFIRTICMLLVFSSFTNAGARLGESILAANAVLLQLFYLMSYGVDGFAYAAESLTGRFIGAKDREQLEAVLKRLMVWGLGLGALYGVVYLLAGPFVLPLFTPLEPVVAEARHYLPWMVAVSLAGAAAFLYDGIYIGATATRALRNNMLWATGLVYFPLLWLGLWQGMGPVGTGGVVEPGWANHAVWGAMTAFMVARSIGLGWGMKQVVLPMAE